MTTALAEQTCASPHAAQLAVGRNGKMTSGCEKLALARFDERLAKIRTKSSAAALVRKK
jgi:hypothetical protein